jgi:hypothetical protein
MRKLAIFAAAFTVATLAFWGTMLTNPPVTRAEETGTAAALDPLAMMRRMSPPAGGAWDAL